MLRVEAQDSANALIVRLEGRFTGGGMEDVRTLFSHCNKGKAPAQRVASDVLVMESD